MKLWSYNLSYGSYVEVMITYFRVYYKLIYKFRIFLVGYFFWFWGELWKLTRNHGYPVKTTCETLLRRLFFVTVRRRWCFRYSFATSGDMVPVARPIGRIDLHPWRKTFLLLLSCFATPGESHTRITCCYARGRNERCLLGPVLFPIATHHSLLFPWRGSGIWHWWKHLWFP